MAITSEDIEPIAVIGLGYVGLPISLAASEKYKTIGFDVDAERISSLQTGMDTNKEISQSEILKSNALFTANPSFLTKCKTFILTLPTPLGENFQPDTSILESGIELISKHLSKGSLIIIESTVYPGCTEDLCIPLIEELTNLKVGNDFGIAYSPERINPGDKVNVFKTINKVVGGIDSNSVNKARFFYESIIDAQVFVASSIKIAEMAKVLENTQRDVNVALINEIAIICSKLKISVHEVLQVAQTKWNFLNFTPGLVGGHCIGVDPYYLAHSAIKANHNPDIILTSRRINENYIDFLILLIIEKIMSQRLTVSRVLILGGTFKENCSDLRNSKSLKMVKKLKEFASSVTLFDSHIDKLPNTLRGIELISEFPVNEKFDLIICLVGHSDFLIRDYSDYDRLLSTNGLIFDFKNFFPSQYARNLIKL
jgi:UDP-N-acetyl-D-galactosamine dehydrogenase